MSRRRVRGRQLESQATNTRAQRRRSTTRSKIADGAVGVRQQAPGATNEVGLQPNSVHQEHLAIPLPRLQHRVPDPSDESDGRMLEVEDGQLVYRDAPVEGGGTTPTTEIVGGLVTGDYWSDSVGVRQLANGSVDGHYPLGARPQASGTEDATGYVYWPYRDAGVVRWDNEGNVDWNLDLSVPLSNAGLGGRIGRVFTSPSGRVQWALNENGDWAVRILDGQVDRILDTNAVHGDSVYWMAVRDDGRTLLRIGASNPEVWCCSPDGESVLWDYAPSATPTQTFWSPNGATAIVVTAGSAPRALDSDGNLLWNGAEPNPGSSSYVTSNAYDGDGSNGLVWFLYFDRSRAQASVFALDATNGQFVAEHDIYNDQVDRQSDSVRNQSRLVVANGICYYTILVNNPDWYFVGAVDLSDGTSLWQHGPARTPGLAIFRKFDTDPPVQGGMFLSGEGAPDDLEGADGDHYLDRTTLALYGPKSAGAWPTSTVSLGGN